MAINLIRIGIVSSINAKKCSARVEFGDKDKLISYELPVLNRGSQDVKDYWLPDINEQVICLFLPNGISLTQGFIIGSFYSNVDVPIVNNANVRRLDFGDGTFLEYNRETKELNIKCAGNININGKTINLN